MSESDVDLAYYGDDLTGSTDAMEALALGGVRTALFLDPPSPEELTGRFADLEAVGVAGRSRSMSPAEMDERLPEVFERFAELDPSLVQYKVCSTFDSAPETGSIGHAIDVAQPVFGSPFVPVVVGVPALERYVVFGNLFATVGDRTYRLDRHPTMSEHPTTPMTESDLGRHLRDQTDRDIDRFDLLALESGDADAEFAGLLETDPEIVVFDAVDGSHLQTVGRLVWERAAESTEDPVFAVGSSGLDYALTAHWSETDETSRRDVPSGPDPVDQLLVMSGSASPETANQISNAIADERFDGIRLDTSALVRPDGAESERERVNREAMDALERGQSVVIYSARGPDDPAIEETRTAAPEDVDVGERIGTTQGEILEAVLRESNVDRVCVAGGDTSGYVTPALDVYALEYHRPLAPGSPLCVASSDDERFDGIQVCLKGGQTGGEHFFETVRRGGSDAWP